MGIGGFVSTSYGHCLTRAFTSGILVGKYFTDQEIIDYRSTLSADKSIMVDFNKNLLLNGVLKGNSKFYISSVHEDDDIQETINALEKTIESIKNN